MRRLAPLLLILALTVVIAPAATGDDGGLGAARAKANRAAAELATAESRADELAVQVADLQRQAAASAAALGQLQTNMRALAVERYVAASQSNRVLAHQDINRQVEADTLLRLVKGADQSTVDQYRAEKDDLEAAQAALASKLDDQQAAVKQLRAKRAAVEAELKHLEALERERQAAAQRAAAAAARPVRTAGVVIASGAWICPVQGPHAFSNDFGMPRSGGRRHQGNDILSPRGTPVVAPVSGVASRRDNGLGGISFWLVGDDDNSYYGAHLDTFAGAVGHVAAGTQLGTVGNTGDARGGPTHLHFEIHPGGGGAINPYSTLVKYC